ncbi:MAG TPA: AAA family ATPase, partial [Caulobacteraceae bacterium]
MPDVFISYGRSTAQQARATAAALRASGYSVWLDEDLPGHRAYADVIEEQIDQAKAVVVIWSAEAVKSHWVRSEADRARGVGKLVQFTVDHTGLPMPFDQIQCLNLTGWSGEDQHPAWPKVVASIEELVRGKVRSAARHGGRTASAEGERRHLTVLACGLADVSSISAIVDPEQWHDIFTRFQRRAAGAVRQMDGHVAQSHGDGFVAYFGYPEAREDAAECAVRSGLAILEALRELNGELAAELDVRLKARVGVHAGTVVVTAGDGDQIGVFGDAPRTALAIEAAAPPDTVMMSGAVHELVSGLFVVEDGGTQPRQGHDQLVRLFHVIRPGLAGGRTRGFTPREESPFVGREDELHVLASRWRRVGEGEGQSVLLIGEPGIGKTRLIEEFQNSIKAAPHLWIEAAGAPLYMNTPFHAVIRMLDQGLGWRGEDGPDERFARLEATLAPLGASLAGAAPLIAELLGLPVPSTYAQPMIPPDQKRRRLLAALTGWVFGATTAQPLVIVIEDLQWADPSTMELVQTLVDQGVSAPLFLICTARPEFHAPWPVRGHHVQVTLSRLSDRQTRTLVSAMVARAGMTEDAEETVDRVVERTDGVPLFAEELARFMSEGEGRELGREIPVTLLDSLAARLDRLGRARETAQLGAVIGREFSYELIAALSPDPEKELEADLAALTGADLIIARGLPPFATYQFKHALIQDAAYDALLKSKRRELHAKVARTIAERFSAVAICQPEVLARHWTEAGEAAQAVTAWKSAGDIAYERRAYEEAEQAYRQALSMLGLEPQSRE